MSKARDAGADPNPSLSDFTNTPTVGVGSSPAQSLLVEELSCLFLSVQNGPYKLKERKAKQTYYYNKGARELDRLKPGDVVRVKLGLDSKKWSKAAVGKEVNIRSYQVHTEEGLTFGRNQRHFRQTREPFSKENFEFSTEIPQDTQPRIQYPVDNCQNCSPPSPICGKVSTSPKASSTTRVPQLEP